jgi:hypothetical protein
LLDDLGYSASAFYDLVIITYAYWLKNGLVILIRDPISQREVKRIIFALHDPDILSCVQ